MCKTAESDKTKRNKDRIKQKNMEDSLSRRLNTHSRHREQLMKILLGFSDPT
jgi:hypothetical protein